MIQPRTVTWLPAHPAMGWASMNRFWLALERQRTLAPPPDLAFSCPLTPPISEQPAAGRWAQRLVRSLIYPLIVRTKCRSDLVHILDHSFADLLRFVPASAKTVVTVHDIIPLLDPTGLSASQVERFRRRVHGLARADLILCVSEFTRQGLLKEVSIDSAKVRVLPMGVDVPISTPPPLAKKIGPTMLLVGSSLKRKNLDIVPAVLEILAARGCPVTVLRVGTPLPVQLADAIRQQAGPGRFVDLGLVSDADLSDAYASADMLFFPSTLEGFGLPVIEAMAHGCPVVASNSSSLPEVGGDAVLYFAPHDPQEAAEQCLRALTDKDLRTRLRLNGRERAATFTWSRHWQTACDLYRETLDSGGIPRHAAALTA